MKNLSNKMLYVNDDGEEIVIPLSRFLVGHTSGSDTVINLYFDSHYEGAYGSAANKVNVTCSSGADLVLINMLGAFASSRDSILDLTSIDARISSVEVIQETVDGAGALTMDPGTGITTGTGTVYKSSIKRVGDFIKTSILIDITGLRSTAGGDIIGVNGTSLVCHLGQITTAKNGAIFGGHMKCLEAAAGGNTDIDLYYAAEGTGVEDGAITDLAEHQLVNTGVAAIGTNYPFMASVFPEPDEYLYLVCVGTNDADYTAGRFLIEMWGV